MATVTKPIALDESINTTEQTPRNIADVLAQELQAVAGAIGGIAVPSADHVSYDNSVSGLSATDVQNALDEIVSDIPTVNNGTLTIQQNGTSIGSFSANTASNVTANIKTPTADKKTATDQFNTVNGGLLQKCAVDLEPVQDLHGYDSPWVGGAGKNKLFTVADNIKIYNTAGTWNGDSYTLSGVTFTILKDGDGNVTGIKANGTTTTSSAISFDICRISTMTTGNYILSGCPSGGGGGTSAYYMKAANGSTNAYDEGSGVNLTVGSNDLIVTIFVGSASNKVFYPMLRLATESDPTFEPYSNICPISGHTEVDLQTAGKNLISGIESGSWGSKGAEAVNPERLRSADFIPILGGETYTVSASNGKQVYIASWEKNDFSEDYLNYSGWQDSPYTVILPNNAHYAKIMVRNSNNAEIQPSDTNVQIELGSTATSYEPYLGHLYQVQIGSTVYGGYVDLVTGVMTATWAEADLGTLNWAYNNTNFLATNISGVAKSGKTCICSCYATVNNVYYATDIIADHSICMSILNTNRLFIHDSGYSDATTFKTAVTGQKVVYELATPTTIQLTPQQIEALVGQNSLSTPLSGQSIDSVEYREVFAFDDVEKVVSLRVPISMLGADESGRTTASQSYASGDYFYKDGYMCKALTSISAGATLTLNTNYSQGTLADILKAIENL